MTRPRRTPPLPPHPDLTRQPRCAFGWLDAALLRDGWLGDLRPNAIAVLVLLALAADRRGASFYSRSRMAVTLDISRAELDRALDLLQAAKLLAHRPWRPGHADGVWQLLPLPEPTDQPRTGKCRSAAEILRDLGFLPAASETAE